MESEATGSSPTEKPHNTEMESEATASSPTEKPHTTDMESEATGSSTTEKPHNTEMESVATGSSPTEKPHNTAMEPEATGSSPTGKPDNTEMESEASQSSPTEKPHNTEMEPEATRSSPTEKPHNTDPDNKDKFVLRQLNVKNFVKFREEQELKFEHDGVYFLIGPNQTGKSSIFEAIRRCMSTSTQSSISKAPNENEDSISVCKFENKTETLYSFYIREAKLETKHEAILFKGCVLLDQTNGRVKEFAVDRVEYNEGDFKSRQKDVKLGTDFPHKSFKLEAFLKWVKENGVCTSENDQVETTCEAMLLNKVNNIVSVFPMRGVGPLQWNKSSKVQNKKENYTEASQRAEVIMWYLLEQKTPKDVIQEDMTRERLFYNFITGTDNVNYIFDERQSPREISSKPDGASKQTEIKPNILVQTSDGDVNSILKQSEGFVEAKLCSILLAVSNFATVLLEEPGSGMHPQMIDRLCTTMNERVQDKVIIVSTHNSNFLQPWHMENIFYFSNELDKGFNITSGKKFKDLKSEIPSSITMEQFANFCYADTIVCVEGVSDQLLLEVLHRILRKPGPEPHMPSRHIQFVNIRGEKNAMKFRNCCKILSKRYAFVLDRDIWPKKVAALRIVIRKEEEAKIAKEMGNGKTQLSKKEKRHKLDEKAVSQQTENEIKNHFFVWNFANLEAVFCHGILEAYKDSSMQDYMEENKGRSLKISYKLHIECDGKEEVKDININGVLKELEDKKIPLTNAMKETLKHCFPDILQFEPIDDTETFILSGFRKKPPKDFKLFLDGIETLDERVKLIEFLHDSSNTFGGAGEIKRLYNFLQELEK